ncbi:MAG TPA: DUF222 domain-containing protein [Acidimicrobiales bacterium]|nr:DUF222 domain-containing protein [Acidimicrobiales bacterium]
MDTVSSETAGEVPLEHLEHEICQLSAHLSAAMCRWLELVAEFDRRQGWGHQGAKSWAQWLSWRCGLSLVAGRQHLRVANRLPALPAVRDAFAAGELTYPKVRALVRIATPESESELVELARHTTAAQLDRIARVRAGVDTGDAEEAARRHAARHVHWFWDDDGSLVLTARLGADEGALVLQALDAAAHALRSGTTDDDPAGSSGDLSVNAKTAVPEDSSCDDPAGSSEAAAIGDPAGSSEGTAVDDPAGSSAPVEPVVDATADARARNAESARVPASRADALVAMAETMLAHGPAARDGGERYQVVITVDVATLAGVGPVGWGEIDDGPGLPSEAARRLACDSTVVAMSLADGGEPLSVGRATPTIPRHIRRALRTRDGGCRFPGWSPHQSCGRSSSTSTISIASSAS